MSRVKIEPTDPDDMEFCYGHRINNVLKQDFETLCEEGRLDFLTIQLYVKQSEMPQLAKILFKEDVRFPLEEETEVSTHF